MPAPANVDQFLDSVRKSGLIEEPTLSGFLDKQEAPPAAPQDLASALVRDGLLTKFQADQLLRGKSRGFLVGGKYKLLEFLGAGGMGSVYLCEHISMRRKVALKVLPTNRGKDTSYLERFYREARAAGALDHPNIVRAHDVDHDGALHFLVMEYVDGRSLQDIVDSHGPLDVERAAHYVSQAALGLQHAHEAGLVHRDIKPGNLLLDRQGTVRLLDMGLARFFHEDDGLSKKYDENILGTTDYLAPEQVIDGKVDIRADIYGLGATFYFLLTGKTLFGKGNVAAKLVWQQVRTPKPIRERRPEVPEELADLIEQKMLAKDPAERFQTPAEVGEALAPWTAAEIAPPSEDEMPQLCPALQDTRGTATTTTGKPSTLPRKGWSVSDMRARTAINGKPPSAIPQEPTRPASRPARKRRSPPVAMLVGLAVAMLLFVVLAPLVAWWAYSAASGAIDAVQHKEPQENRHVQVTPTGGPALPPVPAGEVVMTDDNGVRVRTAGYEAHVGKDGNLDALRVGGVDMLKSGVQLGKQTARAGYFFFEKENNPGVVKLPTIEKPAKNTVRATGDRFAIVYEFAPDSLTLKLTNATDHTVPYYLILDPAVTSVANEKGEQARTPVKKDWATTTWSAGKTKLSITGGTRIWGPWTNGLQVWEASLKTYETRTVVLSAGEPAKEHVARIIHQPGYDATVEPDGCLTSLRVGGTELLRPGADISRGMYLHNGKLAIRMPDVAQPSANVVTAAGPEASMRYEFGPDAITCTATNRTGGGMALFLVFDPAVVAMQDGEGGWAKSPLPLKQGPVEKKWETTTWYAAGASLKVTGGSRIWGPWSGQKLQVWEAMLQPKETRRVVLHTSAPTEAEAAKVAALTGQSVARAPVNVQSPLDYQVFQRRTRHDGQIHFRGRAYVECDRLEMRLVGKSLRGDLPDRWQDLPLAKDTRAFDVALPADAGGWYRAELRALRGGKVVAEQAVAHVGVGEVFVIAGQSNSTNCSPDKLQQATGMVSAFDGYRWRLGDDPQPGVHDHSGGGSPWPAFADVLYERYKVPVGIASCGHSGTSVNQWQPGGELLGWLTMRTRQLGPHGFRALLWHQGESDVGMSSDEYARKLSTVIHASNRAAGWDFPWMVARVSYHNPKNPSFPTTRDAQKKLWDSGVALEGPDTDQLGGDHRSENGAGIHFSAKGLRAHGRLWADKVGAYLDRELGK